VVGRDPRSERAEQALDPVTGEKIEDLLINPLVAGDTEELLDDFEVRQAFDEIRRDSGLNAAKEALPDWEDYTLPGDPYPIPRAAQTGGPTTEAPFKGQHGYLVDTKEEGWQDRFISKVRERAGSNPDSED